MSQTNAQNIFAKLVCSVPVDKIPETCPSDCHEFLKKLQTSNDKQTSAVLTTSFSGTDFVELFKDDSTFQPLPKLDEEFNVPSESDLKDDKAEAAAVWKCIVDVSNSIKIPTSTQI